MSRDGVAGRVSVVVVHYAGASDLSACVASVWAQGHPDIELIVVDNASADRAGARLRLDPAPGRRLRRAVLPRNLGFAGGANAGLQMATGERLLLLNPDAALAPDCVARLLDADADAAAPRMLLRDDSDRLDNCGHGLYPDGLNWCRGRGEAASGRFVEADEPLLFSGAAVLFKRSALVRAGLFDPAYWAYGEDADLSLRFAALGLRTRYVPDALVRHAVGGSFGKLALKKVFLVERNRARVAVTHLPVSWLLASPLWTAVRHAVLASGAAAGDGLGASWSPARRALLPAVVGAAHLASLVQLPGSLARRRALGRRPDRARLHAGRVGPRELAARPAGV